MHLPLNEPLSTYICQVKQNSQKALSEVIFRVAIKDQGNEEFAQLQTSGLILEKVMVLAYNIGT